jgi:hypothetical protein
VKSPYALIACALAGLVAPVLSQPSTPPAGHRHAGESAFEIGGVLNPSWQSRAHALSHRDKGLGLGHSDITLSAKLAPGLQAKAAAVAHSDHHRIATHIEEAYLEAPALPGGMQLRAGRFFSQMGYLNEQHPHADDFVMRPALQRAFLGGHYFDDGLRLNWVAPTEFYWRLGSELLRGQRLPLTASGATAGAYTLSTRLGSDLGRGASWQLGFSTLRHRDGALGAAGEAGHASHEPGEAGHTEPPTLHGSRHNAVFFGRRLDVIEAVWKWAPDGNARARQLRLSAETARASDLGDPGGAGLAHRAWYLAAVIRFHPQWEIGTRIDRLNAFARHEEGFEPARLEERSVAIAWKRDHTTTVRLQLTAQRDRGGFAEASEVRPANAVHVQFVKAFGAHGAHSY